ncbi:MAG: hypothetical protein H0W48_00415 [Methylibium sp.]|nr:hypothetical protein [Methylibium sp.]
MERYLIQNAVALTQALNALLGGWGDESTCSRAHRQQHKARWRIARRVINTLFRWQSSDHCLAAYECEQKRRNFPPVLRERGDKSPLLS